MNDVFCFQLVIGGVEKELVLSTTGNQWSYLLSDELNLIIEIPKTYHCCTVKAFLEAN